MALLSGRDQLKAEAWVVPESWGLENFGKATETALKVIYLREIVEHYICKVLWDAQKAKYSFMTPFIPKDLKVVAFLQKSN